VERLISHYYQIFDSRNNPRVMKIFQRMDVPFPETICDFIKMPYVNNIQTLRRSIPTRDIEIKNQHSFRDAVLRMDSATREFIREQNRLDEDLYQFALQLFKKQFQSFRIVPGNDLRFRASYK
jgi:hypothetical protein